MFMPGQIPMQQKALYLMGRPVGISLKNGRGVSGILCRVENGEIYVMQYMYATQFATFHYPLSEINDIMAYPAC